LSVGYPYTKLDLDNAMGRMIVQIRDALTEATQFKAQLDDSTLLPDATLTALGYTGPEITQIRASFSAMKVLFDISKAAATQPAVNDFWFDAKHLANLNFH